MGGILAAELLATAFVVAPFASSLRSSLLNYVQKQPWVAHLKWGAVIVAGFSALSFYVASRDRSHYAHMLSSAENYVPAYREKQLEAERDRYLAGLVFVVMCLLYRTCSLMLKYHLQSIDFSVLQKQSKNANDFMQNFMADSAKSSVDKIDKEKKEKAASAKNDTVTAKSNADTSKGETKEYLMEQLERAETRALQLQKTLQVQQQEATEADKLLNASLEQANEKAKKAEVQLKAMLGQVDGQQKEYMRLMEENRGLKTKLEDFVFVVGDDEGRKKED